MLGGLVAGNRAGKVYNDWPLMNGHICSQGLLAGRLLALGALHSQAAAQLHHRIGAYLLFIAAWTTAVLARRSPWAPYGVKVLALAVALLVTVQAGLGIITLMMGDPLGMAVMHQAWAAVVLAASDRLRLARAAALTIRYYLP